MVRYLYLYPKVHGSSSVNKFFNKKKVHGQIGYSPKFGVIIASYHIHYILTILY